MAHPNEDYYAWTQETVEKLRQGRLSEINIDHLIEELEDMGKSERRELMSRLIVLLVHLLKWRYQPIRRGHSWELTLKGQRLAVEDVFADNPSLRPELAATGKRAYQRARIDAAQETGLDETTFPATFEQTGWSWDQVLDMDYLPD